MESISITLRKIPSWVRHAFIILGSSLLLGLFANVVIPLPFTPVPIATQPSIVLLLAVLLGSKRAVAAVGAFLAQGAFGLPVFAGGNSGIVKLIGPTGGYLIAYLIAAYVVGKMAEKSPRRSLLEAFLAMGVGNVILFVFGAAWLSTFVGFQKALLIGVVPFLIGDLLKLIAALKILQWLGWHSHPSKEKE